MDISYIISENNWFVGGAIFWKKLFKLFQQYSLILIKNLSKKMSCIFIHLHLFKLIICETLIIDGFFLLIFVDSIADYICSGTVNVSLSVWVHELTVDSQSSCGVRWTTMKSEWQSDVAIKYGGMLINPSIREIIYIHIYMYLYQVLTQYLYGK